MNLVAAEKGRCNAPPLNLKTAKLRQAVQAYEQLGFKLNLVEIAAFAEISIRNAHNQKNDIYCYWYENNNASNADKLFMFDRSLKLVLTDLQSLEEAFGAILGVYLKMETDIIDGASSLREVKKIGEQITKIYRLVCNYRNTQGVPVHSGNKSARYLLTSKIKLDKLFIRSEGYAAGKYAKRWQATDLLKQHIQIVINKLLDMISDNDVIERVYSSPHMFAKNSAKSIQYNNINNIISININNIKEFEFNSIFNLLIRAVKVTKNEIYVSIVHEASTDESLGRSYNVFSKMRSSERLKLGYISYDMNAALQSISLQLIKAKREDYPVLWDYTHDKVYKKRIRMEVAEVLGISLDEVKAKFTAFANGSISGIKLHRYYKAFQKESDRL